MDSKEKQLILARLIEELKQGKSEEEVKKEYLAIFHENEKTTQDSLTNSEFVKKPQGIIKENSDYEKENPLVVFAQENGALKALLDNIAIDLNNSDDDPIGKKMLLDEFSRLREIKIHYTKKEKILFVFLSCYDVDNLDDIQKKDEEVLSLVESLYQSFQKENPYSYRKEIAHVCSLIRENITNENHYLLPILDERLNEDELFYIQKRSDIYGYCLIRHRRDKRHI